MPWLTSTLARVQAAGPVFEEPSWGEGYPHTCTEAGYNQHRWPYPALSVWDQWVVSLSVPRIEPIVAISSSWVAMMFSARAMASGFWPLSTWS